MRPHQAFPKLAVIRDEEVQELVDDDVVPEAFVEVEQVVVEVQVAVGRA